MINFEPGHHRGHGMAHNPLKAVVAPRPIAWITTIDASGRVNLAPFSFFNLVSENPPIVAIGISGSRDRDSGLKDTAANLSAVPEFVINIASLHMRDTVHASGKAYPQDVNEAEALGLALVPSVRVAPPRLAEVPACLECVVREVISLPSGTDGRKGQLYLGEVVSIGLAESYLVDGRFDVRRVLPLARLGYRDYATIGDVYELTSD